MPLVLRDARLADSRRVDISIDDGRVVELADTGCLADEGAEVHDLDGWLVVPAMVEPHAHLDKALTGAGSQPVQRPDRCDRGVGGRIDRRDLHL